MGKSREKGTYDFTDNYEILKQAPLDAREKVPTVADLTKKETWSRAGDKPTDEVYIYPGLKVSVMDKRAVYMYIGATMTVADVENAENWKDISAGGGGAVTSVNGQTGAVVLGGEDIITSYIETGEQSVLQKKHINAAFFDVFLKIHKLVQNKMDKSVLMQTIGTSKTAVMSQDAVTKVIEVRGNNYIIHDGAYTLKEAIDFLAAQMHFADKDIVCGMTITFVLKGAEGVYNAGRTYQLTAYQATGHLDNYFPPESWKEVSLLTNDLGHSEHLAASQKMVTNLIEVRGNNYTIREIGVKTLQEAIVFVATQMHFEDKDIVSGMTITFVTPQVIPGVSGARTYMLEAYNATGSLSIYNEIVNWKQVALLTNELGDSDNLAPTQKTVKTALAQMAEKTEPGIIADIVSGVVLSAGSSTDCLEVVYDSRENTFYSHSYDNKYYTKDTSNRLVGTHPVQGRIYICGSRTFIGVSDGLCELFKTNLS